MFFARVFGTAALIGTALAGYEPHHDDYDHHNDYDHHDEYDHHKEYDHHEVKTTVYTDDYVFFCPEPTTIAHKNTTITVTSAQLVTISSMFIPQRLTTPSWHHSLTHFSSRLPLHGHLHR
ncbi:hypothetical protein BGZ63DRAFT_385708 [Mariannaea sp. PMI_226]|nr:hypothetical protein BGZ63DRAFT_385708 [Mariannaea sp. PMI_226]